MSGSGLPYLYYLFIFSVSGSPFFWTYYWSGVGAVPSSFFGVDISLSCRLSWFPHLDFCLSNYPANLHLRTVVFPCLLQLLVALLLILGLGDLMVSLFSSFSVFLVWLTSSFGL